MITKSKPRYNLKANESRYKFEMVVKQVSERVRAPFSTIKEVIQKSTCDYNNLQRFWSGSKRQKENPSRKKTTRNGKKSNEKKNPTKRKKNQRTEEKKKKKAPVD